VRAAEAEGPLGDAEIDALFAPLAATTRIALAVSGGADSLALLAAVAGWLKRRRGLPEAIVLTVDHRLRLGSDREAAMVAAVARDRGMASRVLPWEGPHPESDIEAAARAARYSLLLGAAREFGASHLLTAHHRDDQAETFLMRLARGSGLFGLAAMRPVVRAGDITIMRPFLGLPRSRLAATAAAAGLVPAEDAMNSDPRFLRVRIRRLMPLLAAEGFEPADLAATAGRLAAAADAMDQWADRVIADTVTLDRFAVAGLHPARFFAEPAEVRLRVLTRLLLAVGGEAYPPRFERLSALHDAMARHGHGRFKRTLAGAMIEARNRSFQVYREIGRDGLRSLPVSPGFSVAWDHRFRIEIGQDAPAGLVVGALGEDGRRAIGAPSRMAPAGALAALPAFRLGPAIVAVPTLSYFREGMTPFEASVAPILAERLATPPRFPDFTAEA
jgi:tRNA(Ile)-lysidine synthase